PNQAALVIAVDDLEGQLEVLPAAGLGRLQLRLGDDGDVLARGDRVERDGGVHIVRIEVIQVRHGSVSFQLVAAAPSLGAASVFWVSGVVVLLPSPREAATCAAKTR